MSDCFERAHIAAEVRTAPGGDEIFAFEQDFAGSLRCIPMIVRFKLDLSGVKLTLRQWSRFDRATRGALVSAPWRTPEEITAYRDLLVDAIVAQADEPVKLLEVEPNPAWREIAQVAAQVVTWAAQRGLSSPLDAQWQALSDLQRFALIKLSRPGHDNDNFYPALVEFGLVEGANT